MNPITQVLHTSLEVVVPPVHIYFDSIDKQSEDHPSEFFVLPSSQISVLYLSPSPQTTVVVVVFVGVVGVTGVVGVVGVTAMADVILNWVTTAGIA